MADPKQQNQDTAKQAPKAEQKKGELSEKDLEQASGGSGVDRPAEISTKGYQPPPGNATQ